MSTTRTLNKDILLTGGSGRLGSELQQLLPGITASPSSELDITSFKSVEAALERYQPKVLVHAAAYTNVTKAERDRERCWEVNVEGTRNVVKSVSHHGLFLIYISTDYVFEGTRGMYHEEDVVGPVQNYYALTKLVAESLVRTLDQHLVIRTSFRPREWPYPVAYTDVYTSQDYVDLIAPEIALATVRYREIPYTTIHIATERKSVFELAVRRRPDVLQGSKLAAGIVLPDDVSLDVERWEKMKLSWKGISEDE